MGQTTRVLASPTTPFGCLVEADQIVVLAGLAPIAEIGITIGSDVALVGDHLAVLAPDGHFYVVDPRGEHGPVVVGEQTLAAGSRIVATTENHALVAGISNAIVEITNQGKATLARLPARLHLDLCAASGLPDQFLIASGDVIEEWSASSRSPVRRFHLDRPLDAGWIGGTARQIWAIANDELLAIKRDGTARPTRIALPEPVARAVGDGTGSVVIVGASSQRAWLVRIGERTVTPLADGPIAELALGRDMALVLGADGTPAQVPCGAAKTVAAPAAATKSEPVVRRASQLMANGHGRLLAWKERAAHVVEDRDDGTGRAHAIDWRDDVVAWMRQSAPPAQLPVCPPVRDVAARLAIDERDIGVLIACYGARLCGHDGATFADLVELTAGRWTEVLGRGSMRASGAFVWHGARVHLAPEIAALLDGAAPIHGTIHDGAPSAASVRRIVAPIGIDLDAIAAWAAPTLGALFAPNAHGLRAPARCVLEARARGIAPLLPWRRAAWPRLDHAVIVVDDPRISAERGPVSLTWSITAAA